MSELQKMLEYAKIALLYSTDGREFWKKRVSELKKAIEAEGLKKRRKRREIIKTYFAE